MITVITPYGPTTDLNYFLFFYRFLRILRVLRVIVARRVVQLLETDIQKQTVTLLCMLFGMVFCVTGLTHLFENQRAWWPEGEDPYREYTHISEIANRRVKIPKHGQQSLTRPIVFVCS